METAGLLFNSYEFIFAFLPIVLAGCFLVSKWLGGAAAQLWLTAASLYFYASWNLKYLPLLLGSILFNYLIATTLVRTPSENRRRALLLAATAVNLALLAYYKYTNFFLDEVNALAGSHFSYAQLALPLGISFYTFQQLTLLVDIGQGSGQGAIKTFRLRDFILFVTFFPHLIAGPIVHHREMMPQFERADYSAKWENLAVGLTLFVVGLFKKAILADGIANQVVPLYAQAATGQSMTLVYAWAAAVGFCLQMYFDFSGYSEMALGLARMVGIKLPMNFNSPLKATNIIQYWACWHITLTRFLTAYLYNPIAVHMTRRRLGAGHRGLAGPKTRPAAFVMITAIPTIVTMFLSGLWHGAGNQFLVFGLLHAFYLTTTHAWRLYRPRWWKDQLSYDRLMRPVGLLLTFLATTIALTFFRADSVSEGANIVAGMAGLHGIALPDVIQTRLPAIASLLAPLHISYIPGSLPALITLYLWMAALLLIALIPPNILQLMRKYEPAITLPAPYPEPTKLSPLRTVFTRLEWAPTNGWAVAVAAMSVMGILALSQVTEFLYWQF